MTIKVLEHLWPAWGLLVLAAILTLVAGRALAAMWTLVAGRVFDS